MQYHRLTKSRAEGGGDGGVFQRGPNLATASVSKAAEVRRRKDGREPTHVSTITRKTSKKETSLKKMVNGGSIAIKHVVNESSLVKR